MKPWQAFLVGLVLGLLVAYGLHRRIQGELARATDAHQAARAAYQDSLQAAQGRETAALAVADSLEGAIVALEGALADARQDVAAAPIDTTWPPAAVAAVRARDGLIVMLEATVRLRGQQTDSLRSALTDAQRRAGLATARAARADSLLDAWEQQGECRLLIVRCPTRLESFALGGALAAIAVVVSR